MSCVIIRDLKALEANSFLSQATRYRYGYKHSYWDQGYDFVLLETHGMRTDMAIPNHNLEFCFYIKLFMQSTNVLL